MMTDDELLAQFRADRAAMNKKICAAVLETCPAGSRLGEYAGAFDALTVFVGHYYASMYPEQIRFQTPGVPDELVRAVMDALAKYRQAGPGRN